MVVTESISILDIPISITIQDALIVLVLIIVIAQVPHFFWWLERRRWNPEGAIFVTARKKGFPIIEKVALSGYTRFELGKKEVKGDPVFAVDRSTRQGVHLDPRMSSGGVPREFLAGGAELMHYSTSSSIAMSSKTALATSTILKYVRKNYPTLSILPDEIILQYLYIDRSYLLHDCLNLTEMYDFKDRIEVPSTVTTAFRLDVTDQIRNKIEEEGGIREPTEDEVEQAYQVNIVPYRQRYQAKILADTFQKVQDESVNLPIETNRYFSYMEAFQNSPMATFPSDLQNYMTMIELVSQLKNSLFGKDRIWIYIIAIVAIIIAGAVAMNMLPQHTVTK